MSNKVEILIDIHHIKRVIKAIVCPVEFCTEDHKVAGTNQYVTHAAIVQWLDSLFNVGKEAIKRASAASVMDGRNLILEADIKAAMETFYFDPKVPFTIQQSENWGTESMNASDEW